MPKPPAAEITRRVQEFRSPRWGYRRGADGEIDSDLFDTDLPDGWADSPAGVDGVEVATIPPAPGESGYAEMSANELRALLKERTGKGPRPGTPTEDIVAALELLDEGGGDPT